MNSQFTNGADPSAQAPSTKSTRFAFGLFEIDISTGELRRAGHRLRFQRQPFNVLAALLEEPGKLVSRQELQEKIWGTDVVVDFEHALGNAIKKVRDAIGDSAENPRFIETVAKGGYRFIAPVTALSNSTKLPTPMPVPPSDAVSPAITTESKQTVERGISHPRLNALNAARLLALLSCVLILAVLVLLHLLKNKLPVDSLRISQVTFDGGIYPQGARSPETLSPLGVGEGRIFSSSINESHITLLETDLDTGLAHQVNLPTEVQEPEVDDISPDGSKLLVRSHSGVELQEAEQPLWVIPTDGGSAFRVGDLLSHAATWMPDGTGILYATGNRIESVSLEGRPSKLFAEVQGRPFWLRWSPDGKILRFTIVDLQQNTTSLWELRAGEHIAHRLSFGPNVPENVCCGTWTSNGKFFVIQGTHHGDSDLWELSGESTTRAKQITNGPLYYTSPAAGKDAQIFFQGVDSAAPVEEREFDASRKEFLPREDFLQEAVRIAFSLDHQWVAWTDVPGHLWRARVDGSEKLQLTTGPMVVLNFAWTTDDRRLAIMAKSPNQGWQIFWIGQSGGSLEQLLSPAEQAIGDPTFSPDGKYLAFGGLPTLMGGEISKHPPIRILDLASKHISNLPNSVGLFSPRWSPDGRYIAALTLDQHKLMIYDVAAQSWKVIATMSASDPLWSPDGKSLYFYASVSENRPIYRISIPDLKIDDIFHPSCGHYNCVLSGINPDNEPLIRVDMTRSNIFRMNLNGN